jgi:CubicO group peptidase (beta-lactamase class C family)
MLIPLVLTVAPLLLTDTIPASDAAVLGDPVDEYGVAAAVSATPVSFAVSPRTDVTLLGEPIRFATFVNEESPPPPPAESVALLPFQVLASSPFPGEGLPGLPVHQIDAPVNMGFTPAELDRAIQSVYDELYRGQFPGAAIAIGRWGSTVIEQGFGTLDRSPGSPTVDPDYAIYDLASLTKVIATTTAVMLLHEDGRIHLDAPVSQYLPAFSGPGKDAVTIRHLLTHMSGLPAGGDVSGPTVDAALWKAVNIPLKTRPGQVVEYSDIGFIVLWAAAESAYGAPLTELLRTRVFEPLGMNMTSFQPGESCIRCAPTAPRPGYQGVVHDPIARRLGGVAGHAGLFSTVHDLSKFAAMLASRGELNGVRVFRPETIELFTQRQPGADVRALGWETPAPSGTGAGGIRISSTAFGHTGFTGTSLWVDPQRGTWVVLLSNRTYDDGPNRMQALRRTLNDSVAIAVDPGSD